MDLLSDSAVVEVFQANCIAFLACEVGAQYCLRVLLLPAVLRYHRREGAPHSSAGLRALLICHRHRGAVQLDGTGFIRYGYEVFEGI